MADQIGYGATLAYSSDGSSYNTLASITEMDPPDVMVTKVKKTHLLSANAAHEKMSGLIDTEDFKFKMLYDKTRHNTLYGLLRTTYFWKITTPDASTFVFNGFVSKIGFSVPVDDKMETDVEVACTGKPTFTP